VREREREREGEAETEMEKEKTCYRSFQKLFSSWLPPKIKN
jgi:hypothetical protein